MAKQQKPALRRVHTHNPTAIFTVGVISRVANMGDSMPDAKDTKNRASVKKGGNVCSGQAPVTQPTFCKLLTSSIHPRKGGVVEFAINCLTANNCSRSESFDRRL
jgi:hypothetical protein